MKSGLYLLDKAPEESSAKAISRLKRKLSGIKKIGHAGTLDPMATGLLVCLVNGATRLARFAEAGEKIYSGSIQLGLETSTDDITGEVSGRSDDIPDFDRILECAEQFSGEVEQVPPIVSALKVDGVRSYKLARQGLEPELASRKIHLHSFTLQAVNRELLNFSVHCSKGTYIRALARDLGAELGCGACLAALRREGSAPFHVREAKTHEDIGVEDLFDWRVLFPEACELALPGADVQRLKCGDQRLLRELKLELRKLQTENGRSANRAVCIDEESRDSLALFVHEGGQWTLGANVA